MYVIYFKTYCVRTHYIVYLQCNFNNGMVKPS
jgi:hypothetical protein